MEKKVKKVKLSIHNAKVLLEMVLSIMTPEQIDQLDEMVQKLKEHNPIPESVEDFVETISNRSYIG